VLARFLDRYQAALLVARPEAPRGSQGRSASKTTGKRTGGPKQQQQQAPAAKAPSKAGRRAVTQDPRAEAWSALFEDIGERVKNKRCSLEDIQRAVALLPPARQQLLACATCSTPAGELPMKLLSANEALSAARAALAAAAAAAVLHVPLPLEASKAGAGEWRGRGLHVGHAREAGEATVLLELVGALILLARLTIVCRVLLHPSRKTHRVHGRPAAARGLQRGRGGRGVRHRRDGRIAGGRGRVNGAPVQMRDIAIRSTAP
jgi:hypothetical protein